MTLFLKKYYAIIVGIGVFGVYWYTLCPSLDNIDCGELATAQATLSICHPTGYPLFMILGYLWLLVPLPFTKIYQANLLCAFWCAAGVTFFIYFLQSVIANPTIWAKRERTKKSPPPKGALVSVSESPNDTVVMLASAMGGIVLAFSKTYWLQSNSVEVYSLHMFLVLAIIFCLSKAVTEKEPSKNWLIFSVVLGLGFTNHMAVTYILPAAAYVYFAFYGFRWKSVKPLGKLFVYSMIPIFLLYSFLLWRSSQQPPLNWGDPSNLTKLYRHVSGAQFGGALFSSVQVAEHNFLNYLRSVPFEFAFGSLFFAVAGIPFVFRKARKLFYFLVIGIGYTVLFSINYDVRDIYTYYLLSYIGFSVFIAFGIYAVLHWLMRNKLLFLGGLAVTCGIIGTQMYLNFGTSHRGLYTYEDYARNLINSVDSNAVIFTSRVQEWDYISSQLIYLQYVEHLRTDVVVINAGLLEMPWYLDQLEQFHPGFFKYMKSDMDQFSRQYEEFYKDNTDVNMAALMKLYDNILARIVHDNTGSRPIYFTSHFLTVEYKTIKIPLPEDYDIIPDLLLFKVVKDPKVYHPLNLTNPQVGLRLPQYKNAYIREIEKQSSEVLAARARIYEKQFGKSDTAQIILNLLKENFPDFKYE
jgi:Protein of unknown function (DUF2723)